MDDAVRARPLCVLAGVVVHGRGNGRTVGMPTANLRVEPGTTLPACGVYATVARFDGEARPGVTNVGRRPSVDDEQDITVETFFPGYAGDLYARAMTLEFYLFLRPVKKFASLEQVKSQVEADAAAAMGYLREIAAC